jgi:hypothetical protein
MTDDHDGLFGNVFAAIRMGSSRALLVAVASALVPATPAMALECPTPHPASSPGVMQETPAEINVLGQILASGDLSNQIPVYIQELRARHPSASGGELVDYMVTAYCPIVQGLPGLSDAEKRARVEAFASAVAQAAY